MEKINISFKLLLLFVLLTLVLSAGAFFIYAKAFTFVLGGGLIISTLMIIGFLFFADERGEEK